jgi:hypothetical protein
MDTLEPHVGVPVGFQTYSGDAETYITFFVYNEQGELFADDDEIETGYYIQVDIWTKSDYKALEELIKTLMKSAGSKRTTSVDLYEKETQIYHKGIRFKYLKEV